MIALLQRVTEASVRVRGEVIGAIERGLLVLLGIERGDTETCADRMVQRLLGYRIFADADGKMNLDVRSINGGVLLVPQFTLAANTDKGMRPSFSAAAPPEQGERLFWYLHSQLCAAYSPVAVGRFGADMQVALVNDGPVTFNLRVRTDK